MNENIFDTIIIGSGPAGLTAAIYNVRANLKTLVLGGDQPGGQLTLTTHVENYPGFATGIGGLKLMMDMQAQVTNLGVEVRSAFVKNITKADVFELEMNNGDILKSKAVIVTTGAKARWLGLPKEKELIGKGVSSCATCDGAFFRNKVVAVVGGGDVAGEDSSFLSKFASKVYIIHRRDMFRMQPAITKKIEGNPKIEIIWNSEVIEINPNNQETSALPKGISYGHHNDQLPNDKLQTIKIKNNKTGEEKVMTIDGMFVAIGHDPATSFVKELVELKEAGQIIVGKHPEFLTMSSMPGIFAAGDCVDDLYRQAIVAAGDGCKAAMDAERWLASVNS